MYQALYRKWRPQTFDQVVGQKHITETLKNQVISGRLSHAYIFIGTRGTGKTTCARILAKAVNCQNPVDGNPCGICPSCRGISDGSVLDIVELDAASNNGVDNVRALREEAIFSPAAVKKRVYIIDEVHMLSTSAFNALLKILEEPPEHLMFILATTELQKVPATVLSRCQRHQFHRIDVPTIAEYLSCIADKEQFHLTGDAAELIARMADGGVRDALSLLDQCSAAEKIDVDAVYAAVGLAGNRRTARMLEYITDHDTPAALTEFGQLWLDGKDPASFLTELNGLLRDLLMISVAPKGGLSLLSGGYDMTTLKAFAAKMTVEELLCAMDTVRRSIDSMRDARSPRTAAELCLVSLCNNTLGEDIGSLRARVSRLEARLDSGEVCVPVQQPTHGLPVGDEYDDEEPEYSEAPPERRYDEPEDELDPADFIEEQPEDAFIQKNTPKPEKTAPSNIPQAEAGEELWKMVCDKAAVSLPMDVRLSLNDESKVTGAMSNGVLRIMAEPVFMYGRLNKSDIMKIFSDAVSDVLGKSVNAVLAQLQKAEKAARDVGELKQFPETKFI